MHVTNKYIASLKDIMETLNVCPSHTHMHAPAHWHTHTHSLPPNNTSRAICSRDALPRHAPQQHTSPCTHVQMGKRRNESTKEGQNRKTATIMKMMC